MCKENKLKLEEHKNNIYWNNFAVKGVSLKDHIRKSGEMYQDDILKDNSPQYKGFSTILS